MALLARRTDLAGDQLDDVARGVGRVDEGLRTLDANARRVDLVSDMAELAGEASQLADALGRVAGRVVEIGSGFESAQARISQVLTDANAIEGLGVSGTLEELGESALGAAQARVGSISPEAFANATYSGISAGLTASFADAQAQVAGVLGQAAGAGVEEASSTLLTAFIALGNKANEPLAEMQAIADDLATTQQLFRIEGLGQLQQSLEPVAGLAAAFGVSRDETLAAIGILNTALEGGAPAGTAFKSFLAQLPAAADKLGIEVATTETGGVAVLETLERIRALGEGLGAAEFGALLSGALGTEAGPAAVALLGNMDQLTGAVDSLSASQGAAQTAAEKVAATYAAQQERLANTSEALQIQLSGGALAVQRWGLQAQQAAVDTLAWAASLPGIGDTLAGVAGGALAAGAGVAGFAAQGLEVAVGLASTVQLMQVFNVAARASAIASGLASVAARGLGLAMTFATGPIGLIVLGVGAAIAAGVLLWRNWDAVSAGIQSAWEGVAGFFAGVWSGVVGVWENVVGFFVGVWDRVTGFFGRAWRFVTGVLDLIPNGVLVAVAAFLPIVGIPALIIKNWEGITAFFGRLAGGIGAIWSNAWTGFVGVVSDVWGAVTGFVSRGWDSMMGILGRLQPVLDGVARIWEGFTGLMGRTWRFYADLFEGVWNRLLTLFGQFRPVVDFFRRGWDAFVGIWRSAVEAITGVWDKVRGIWESVTSTLGRIWDLAAIPEFGQVNAAEVLQTADQLDAMGGGVAAPTGVEAGASVPQTMATGVTEGGNLLEQATVNMLQTRVEPYQPQSDAERGPLSRLTAAGQAIPTTMAEGVIVGAPALEAAIAALPAPAGTEPAAPSPVAEGVATVPPAITVEPSPVPAPIEPAGVAPAIPAPEVTTLPAPVTVTSPEGVAPVVTAPGAAITVEPAGVAPVVEATPAPVVNVAAAAGVAPVVAVGLSAPETAAEPAGAAPLVVEPGAPGEAPAAPVAQFAPLVAVMRELIASSREQTAATNALLAEYELKRLMHTDDEPERRAPNPRPWELRDSLGEFDATVMPS